MIPSGTTSAHGGRPEDVDRVLDQIREAVVELYGFTFDADDIRVDANVFEGTEELVAGRPLDSMDLVQTMAVIEELFDVPLAPLLTGDDPLSLVVVARYLAESVT